MSDVAKISPITMSSRLVDPRSTQPNLGRSSDESPVIVEGSGILRASNPTTTKGTAQVRNRTRNPATPRSAEWSRALRPAPRP